MAWKEIIGKSFGREEFRKYVASLKWDTWKPEFIVLHCTAVPSLAMRPQGINEAQIESWVRWYRDNKGWSAGPHLFVDDDTIWVFTPLTTPGVHAKNWNNRTLGLEMLGNFDTEPFDSGRGALVRDNAVAAIAILTAALGLDPDSMKGHRDYPGETKTCPGKNVNRQAFIQAVKEYLAGALPAKGTSPATNIRPIEFALAEKRLPIFRKAAAAYRWPEELEAAMLQVLGVEWMVWVLMGINSRESRFGELLDAEGLGDHGHGHGEMQIDDRSHTAFCASGRWRDLAASLEYIHKNVIVPSFNYLGEHTWEALEENYETMFWATIAAYNAGPGNVRKALDAGADPDSVTTGRDYSRDVKARAIQFKEELT